MINRHLASLCLVLGVAVLAGPGWALVAGGTLLWTLPVCDAWEQRVKRWLSDGPGRLAAAAGRGARWAKTRTRGAVAVAAMPTGLVVTPLGVAVLAGPGWALVAGGTLLIGLAVLVGWDA